MKRNAYLLFGASACFFVVCVLRLPQHGTDALLLSVLNGVAAVLFALAGLRMLRQTKSQ